MALTDEERADVERLISHLRGLGMGYAAIDPEELARLERLASSSANVVWFIDPTLAREKGSAIDRHLRFVRASATFARTMRTLLEEEMAELPTRPASRRDASSSSPRCARPVELAGKVVGCTRPIHHEGDCDGSSSPASITVAVCLPGAPAVVKCTRCGARPGGQHTTPVIVTKALLTRLDELGRAPEAPPLYQSGVRYQPEPLGTEEFPIVPHARGVVGDCVDEPARCSICGRWLVEGHAPGCVIGAGLGQ